MKRLVLGVALALTSVARADDADTVTEGGNRFVKTTVIDFEGDTIEGDLSRPDGEYVEARSKVKHTNLIRVREEFKEKVMQSVESSEAQHLDFPSRAAMHSPLTGAAVAVPLTLKVFKGDELIASRDYDRDIIKIGRLSSAHLCLDDERVSRIHSVIEVGPEGQLSIIDMGSVEGTYVNGKRVNKGAIAFGDVVKVGNTTIRVENATEVATQNLASAAEKADLVKPTKAPIVTGEAAVVIPGASQLQAQALVMNPAGATASGPDQQIQAAAPAAATAAAAPVAPAEPEVPRHLRKKAGVLGASLRFRWGRQIVGEYLIKPDRSRPFTVGTAAGVDFVLDDPKLLADRFELVRVGQEGFLVRFPGKIKGKLLRGEDTLELTQLIENGKVAREEGVYALVLGKQDELHLELGGVLIEIGLEPVPKPVWVPWQESVDFAALNIFLVMFFIGALFVITAVNREAEGEQWLDELNADSRIVKLVIKPPEAQKNPFLEKLKDSKLKEKPKPAERFAGDEGKAGKKDAKDTGNKMAPKGKPDSKDTARMIMAKLMGGTQNGGLSTVMGKGIGGELRAMMGNLTGRVAGDSNGMSGLGLKGGMTGGGQLGNSIGIGGVGTRFGGDNRGGIEQVGRGIMGQKKSSDIEMKTTDPIVTGNIDPELIRRVIHSHRDQIRYCYEMELVRQPKLGGKVKVRFVIAENGMVRGEPSIADSSAHNPNLEHCIATKVKTWEFPKPKGGGVAIVSYPFIFKQGGE